jgi:protein-S-isoprenylcysteine O-methyltransferase Ste14
VSDLDIFFTLTVILVALSLIWGVTDPRPFRSRIESYFKTNIFLYILFEILVIILSYISVVLFPFPPTPFDNFIHLFGLVLFASGIFIAVWAKITMGKYWGVPDEHGIERQDKLITNGPFRFSRHPIYLGLILVFFGYFIAIRSIFVVLGLIVYYRFNKASKKEEGFLRKHFGKEYLEYQKNVPRFFKLN